MIIVVDLVKLRNSRHREKPARAERGEDEQITILVPAYFCLYSVLVVGRNELCWVGDEVKLKLAISISILLTLLVINIEYYFGELTFWGEIVWMSIYGGFMFYLLARKNVNP